MATHKGNNGVITVGAEAVAEITGWSVTETEGTVEDTAMGDTARTYLADDLPTWSGSLNCHYDPTDTDGQEVLAIGATVTLELSSRGTGAGMSKMSGSAIVTSRQYGEVANATVVPLAIQFQGTGALTHGTHSA